MGENKERKVEKVKENRWDSIKGKEGKQDTKQEERMDEKEEEEDDMWEDYRLVRSDRISSKKTENMLRGSWSRRKENKEDEEESGDVYSL